MRLHRRFFALLVFLASRFSHNRAHPRLPNRFSNAGLGWKMTLGELVAPRDPAALPDNVMASAP